MTQQLPMFVPGAHEVLGNVHTEAALLLQDLEEAENEAAEMVLIEALLMNQDRQAHAIDTVVNLSHYLKAQEEGAKAHLKAYIDAMTQIANARIGRLQRWQAMINDHVLGLVDRKVLPEKMPGHETTISIRKNPPSCQVFVDPEELPEEFQRVKVEADKKAITAALKTGKVVDGAELVQTRRVVYELGTPIDPTGRKYRHEPHA